MEITEEFKASQYKRIQADPRSTFWPCRCQVRSQGWQLDNQPWRGRAGQPVVICIRTRPTNNPERFDLWAEVVIAGKRMRFSNWERDPVVLQPRFLWSHEFKAAFLDACPSNGHRPAGGSGLTWSRLPAPFGRSGREVSFELPLNL